MRFRILGPLDVRGDDSADRDTSARLVPARRRDRLLLAALLLRPNEPVGVGVLGDPGEVSAGLAVLRRRLGADRLVADRAGWRLRVAAGELDAAEFERLAAEGRRAQRAGDHGSAVERLGRALACWRGPVLTGLSLPPALEPARTRLAAARLDALEDSLAARLDLADDPGALTAELVALTTEHPGREGFWVLLVRALVAADRVDDALAAYQRAGAVGPQLRELHERLGTPARPVPRPPAGWRRPRQLPAGLGTFAGRADQLRALDELADGGGVAVLSGPPGIGKTTLALHWAHANAERFPDGQLYADLRGFAPDGAGTGPVPPNEALRALLLALGAPARELPESVEALVPVYRGMLAGRRVLVVLDNAADAAQVRPLLPGTPTSAVLVTSRNRLSALVSEDGARGHVLGLPTTEEAGELLARRIGAGRLEAAPDAARAIMERCGRLPLALAIVATHAALRPGFTLAAIAAELGDADLRNTKAYQPVAGSERLDALADGDGTDVRAVFSWSYRLLTPAAARLLRLLAVHPGPDITPPAAASLAGVPPEHAESALAELTAANLLGEPQPGRYALHDLIRAYAGELAWAANPDPDRQAALVRGIDHYVHSAYAAVESMKRAGPMPLGLAPVVSGVRPELAADQPAATAWLGAECAVLGSVLVFAIRAGMDAAAWQLGWVLAHYLESQGRWYEWLELEKVVIGVAERLGDPAILADTYRRQAGARARNQDLDGAVATLHQALELFERLGATGELGRVYLNLSSVARARGDYATAVRHAERSLALFEQAGDQVRGANARGAIGWYLALLDRPTEAMPYCLRALADHQRLGNRTGEALTWDTLGYAHKLLGQYVEAMYALRRAVAASRDAGVRTTEWRALNRLGDVNLEAGDEDGARQAWTEAIEILADLGETDELARVEAKLAGSR